MSCLSPYVRRRLVLEEELVASAMADHGINGAEKFIQEVFWRGYFKGWLERRPLVWRAYVDGLARDRAALAEDRQLAKRLAAAEDGRTGLECFDGWVEELTGTGYLHNHARMWFASIWVFTLDLPWRLGADFFYRHLLDGDPASNTLSWRWVAGLHTRGKHYVAQAWNISKFTHQRLTPRPSDLNEVPEPLDWTEPDGLPPVGPCRAPTSLRPDAPFALFITEEDCHPESWPVDVSAAEGLAVLTASHLRSTEPASEIVTQFEADALADTARRIGKPVATLEARDPRMLVRWARDASAEQIVTGYIPEGPLRDWMTAAEPELASAGLRLVELRRDWDAAIWPYATAGFFKVKKKIPGILQDLGIEERQLRLL